MAVKIRLKRMGKKKQPTYRVVVADGRSPRDGRFSEAIGRYDPRQEPSIVEIDNDKALDWLQKGAQPTDPVRKLLEISGAWSLYKVARGEIHTVPSWPAKPAKEEPSEEPQTAPEVAEAVAVEEAAVEPEAITVESAEVVEDVAVEPETVAVESAELVEDVAVEPEAVAAKPEAIAVETEESVETEEPSA